MTRTAKVLAQDLMSRDLVFLRVSAPIHEAVETLEEYRISGAPVVNEAEELVGVLSASDIVKAEHIDDDRLVSRRAEFYSYDPLWEDGDADSVWQDRAFGREDYRPELLGRETVGDWMTARVISVAPDASLRDVCAVIDAEKIHRVFVIDGKKLVGVISTIDIVSFLARS